MVLRGRSVCHDTYLWCRKRCRFKVYLLKPNCIRSSFCSFIFSVSTFLNLFPNYDTHGVSFVNRYGAAIAFEPGSYNFSRWDISTGVPDAHGNPRASPDFVYLNGQNRSLYCPYAFRGANYSEGQPLYTMDLADGYDYTINGTEWYTYVCCLLLYLFFLLADCLVCGVWCGVLCVLFGRWVVFLVCGCLVPPLASLLSLWSSTHCDHAIYIHLQGT